MELTTVKVSEILKDCLFKEDEDQSKAVIINGVVSNYGLHPDRLKNHILEIEKLLAELPDSFHEGKGGGMSFLNACMDRSGRQWGEHRNIEELVVLGLAVNKVKYCAARDMWAVFPGGMPYFVVTKSPAKWYNNERDSHFYGKDASAKKDEAETT